MEKHRKHSQLSKRNNGFFAPNEIAILGTKCSIISELVQNIAKNIQKEAKIAYLDASHNKDISVPMMDSFTFHDSGGLEITTADAMNRYNDKIRFSTYDMLFINGNHYQGEQQILILDNEKESSVLRRIDQLQNIQFVIKLEEKCKFFDFLLEKYPNIKNLHCYSISEIDKISRHVENLIQQKIAPVQGLVLAGGKSIRMGSDKGLLDYYGKAHRDLSIEMLKKLKLNTYLSVRKEQAIKNKLAIEDVFISLGPFGAICSAFQSDPNSAWLVLATDLPFVDEKILKKLLEKRNPAKIATAIKGENKDFPEPLITIWEPKSYPILLNYLAQGISCPRKVLINNDVEIVEIDDAIIRNINTPEEFDAVKKEIND
jgi:molybdopterin-guanine dinucleotide biosynthesis protein A